MNEEFKRLVSRELFTNGPHRVMIGPYEATSLKRAVKKGFNPDIVFVRNDGWTLGAPEKFEKDAHDIWFGEWIYFVRKPGRKLIPMSEYRKE